MLARDGRSKPRAVPGPARAGGRRRRAASWCSARPGRGRRRAARRAPTSRPRPRPPTPKAKRKRKVYVVKPGDTPSGIAEKTGRLARAAREGQPEARPAAARARSADPAPAVTRAALGTAARGRRSRCWPPLPRRPPSAPARATSSRPARSSSRPPRARWRAPRNADERRSIASTTKLMTALLTLERAKLSRRLHRRALLPQPGRVADRAAAGGADDGARPPARPARRVGQRRRGHARRGRQRLAPRVRARDEPPRGAAQAHQHALREPDRARRAGQLLQRPRPRPAGHLPAHQLVLPHDGGPPDRAADLGQPRAHVRQPQRPRRALPLDQRRQERPHLARRATCWSGPGATSAGSRSSPPCSARPSVAARDDATLRLLEWGRRQFQRVTVVERGDELARVPIRYRRGAELALVAERSVRRVVPRGQRDDVTTRVVGAPDDVAGPIVAGQAYGTVEIVQKGKRGAEDRVWSPPRASRAPTSSRRRSPGSPGR